MNEESQLYYNKFGLFFKKTLIPWSSIDYLDISNTDILVYLKSDDNSPFYIEVSTPADTLFEIWAELGKQEKK